MLPASVASFTFSSEAYAVAWVRPSALSSPRQISERFKRAKELSTSHDTVATVSSRNTRLRVDENLPAIAGHLQVPRIADSVQWKRVRDLFV